MSSWALISLCIIADLTHKFWRNNRNKLGLNLAQLSSSFNWTLLSLTCIKKEILLTR